MEGDAATAIFITSGAGCGCCIEAGIRHRLRKLNPANTASGRASISRIHPVEDGKAILLDRDGCLLPGDLLLALFGDARLLYFIPGYRFRLNIPRCFGFGTLAAHGDFTLIATASYDLLFGNDVLKLQGGSGLGQLVRFLALVTLFFYFSSVFRSEVEVEAQHSIINEHLTLTRLLF